MSDSVHVLGICGSLRRGSFNAALLRAASELLPPGMTLTIHDLRSIPLFDGDVEAAGLPASVTALQSAIREADGVLIATPEYNYSIPGVLKHVANAGKLVSPEGVLTDEGTREKIRTMLAAFALWIRPSVTA